MVTLNILIIFLSINLLDSLLFKVKKTFCPFLEHKEKYKQAYTKDLRIFAEYFSGIPMLGF